MAKDYSPEQRAALRAHRIDLVYLLDLFVDGTSLHCSNLYIPFSFDVGDGVTRAYEIMGGRWDTGDDPITMGSGDTPEGLTINLDASRAGDDADFVGRLIDSQWHRRRARVSLVTCVVGTNFATPIDVVAIWDGEMDYREFPEGENAAPTMALTVESGTFRYLGRNVQTRTDENQQRFFPGDTFFQDLPGQIGRELPWHRGWVGVVQTLPGGTTGGNRLNGGTNNHQN